MQRLTEGIGRGEFIVLAARPSVGKTTFVLNWCNWLGCDASILFLSLEMSKQEITRSLMRIATRKPLSRDASPSEIRKAAESIQRLNIRIEEASGAKASNIAASIRQQNNKRKVDIVVIDYLQRIRGEGKSRYEDMTEISNDLADLAHGSKITVVALAQLNRASEAAADHRPKMSHLRESGAIEQDADMIFLMSRLNNEIGRDGGDEPINVELAKNRNGKVGSIQFLFRKSEGTFSEIEG
jgi:replicative DNA helicase